MAITKVVEGRLVTIDVGSIVENANRRHEPLLPSDWDKAAFRFPNSITEWREIHAIAINIKITGRSFQYRNGNYYVKLTIEWVGDGEPSTFTDGWLLVHNVWDLPLV